MHKKYLRDIIISSVTLFSLLTGDGAWAMEEMPERKCQVAKHSKLPPCYWIHTVKGRDYDMNTCPECYPRTKQKLHHKPKTEPTKKKKTTTKNKDRS